MDLKHVKMIIYDEADEIFQQQGNQQPLEAMIATLQKLNVQPEQIFFSATYTPEVIEQIKRFVPSFKHYSVNTASLKLVGVKQFKYQVKGKKMVFL